MTRHTAGEGRDERSRALFARAEAVMPGGVSSPVRAFRAVGGTPRFVAHASGAHVTDVDGNVYLDFVMSWGPLILGHAPDTVVAAVTAAAARGTSYGAPHLGEVELAELVTRCYPGVERVRFTSSGTEAVQSAVRLARGVTGRSRIVKFDGCYHGHTDGMLVAAGSGAITLGQPSSAGVPEPIAALTSVLPLDDEAAAQAFFAAHGDEVAAVLIEPVPANNGLLLQRRDFLLRLRELTAQHGALLLFDEVISGFRVARGGAAELYDIRPDLATFGKVIGGGLPCGAFAGNAAVMEHLAPNGKTYHAGTLSGNPLAMAAGLATLRALQDGSAFVRLEQLSARLQRGVEAAIAAAALPVRFVRQGSLFWLSFAADAPPRRSDRIAPGAAARYRVFFHRCLQHGVQLAPSAYEVGFVSLAHGEADIDEAARVLGDALVHAHREAP
ncbi:MAG TPA: glutamate-1-semialdehyde 2,1-aminomutase [Planctomycetota bacterium]|nr:glutamate-1-semialdehyde 2,1-aminomutase [Planctomycetota bacterium]